MPYLLLILGVFSCSTSVIFIKISETHPMVLSCYRLLLGGALLAPFLLLNRTSPDRLPTKEILRRAFPPAVFLSVHFVTWIMGARMTPSANASLIVNMVPVAMPFLLLLVIRERVTRAEICGTVLGMSGVLLLGFGDFHLSREHAMGDAVCFLSMLFYAAYLIYARKNRDLPSIYLYVVPVYLMAGLMTLLGAGLLEFSGRNPLWIGPSTGREAVAILGLALVPTVIGHSLINWALRVIRGQAVAILNLSQFIFAGLLGFLILEEVPPAVFYLASVLVITGAVIVVRQKVPPA